MKDLITRLKRRCAEFSIGGSALDSEDIRDIECVLEAWEWLAKQTNLSLDFQWERPNGEPDDPGEWVVHRVSGGVNDREWDEIAAADTPLAAILLAKAVPC